MMPTGAGGTIAVDPTAWTRLRGCRVETIMPRDSLCFEGDPADHFWLVIDGALAMTQRSAEGQVTRAIRGPGESVAETDALLGQPHGATVQAVEPALVVQIFSAAVAEALHSAPELGVELLRTICCRQSRANEGLQKAPPPPPGEPDEPGAAPRLSAAAIMRGGRPAAAPVPAASLPPEELARLQQGHAFRLIRGWRLFKEDDPSTHFYLIVEGKIRIHIAAPPGSADADAFGQLTLATLGPGEFFGEIAALTGVRRTAAATALERSLLLAFDQKSANDLMRLAPNIALRLLRALCRRLEGTERKVAEADAPHDYFGGGGLLRLLDEPGARLPEAQRPGGDVTAHAGESAVQEQPPADTSGLPGPAHDRSRLWGLEVQCPLCATSFTALNVRPRSVALRTFWLDLYWEVQERAPNPVHYAVWACPSCGYAAFPGDWQLPADDADAVRQALVGVGDLVAPPIAAAEANVGEPFAGGSEASAIAAAVEGPAPTAAVALASLVGERDGDRAAMALELALRCYGPRPGVAIVKAVLHHYRAWLARDRLDEESERQRLAAALEAYREAEAASLYRSPRAQMRSQYLMGELALRLERPEEALEPLERAMGFAKSMGALGWAKLAEDRRNQAQEDVRLHSTSLGARG